MERKEFDALKQTYYYNESDGFKTTGHKVERTLFCESKSIESLGEEIEFKYKEKIVFHKEQNEKTNKKAICIGYNPANASEEIDITNKRLIDCLWEEYDEYTLINLYPQVSLDKAACLSDLKENQNFSNVIIDIIKKEKDCIILFFGKSVYINEDIYSALKKRIKKRKPTRMTTYNEKFTHPRSNIKVELMDVKKDNLISLYKIV